jgi:hypothetical protein
MVRVPTNVSLGADLGGHIINIQSFFIIRGSAMLGFEWMARHNLQGPFLLPLPLDRVFHTRRAMRVDLRGAGAEIRLLLERSRELLAVLQ